MAKKLLVIDDQTGITKVVELIARQLGLNAKSLNSSSNATEVFIAFKPDVVMLDMIMPEKDGIDVLNEILLTGIPVKVILTSGFSDSYLRLAEGVARFHDNEHVSVLRKPFRRKHVADGGAGGGLVDDFLGGCVAGDERGDGEGLTARACRGPLRGSG